MYFRGTEEYVFLAHIQLCVERIANLRPRLLLAALSWSREGIVFSASVGASMIASFVGVDWRYGSEAQALDAMEPYAARTAIQSGVARVRGPDVAADLSLAECTVMVCCVSTAARDEGGKNKVWRSLCRTAIRMYDATPEAERIRGLAVHIVCESDFNSLRGSTMQN